MISARAPQKRTNTILEKAEAAQNNHQFLEAMQLMHDAYANASNKEKHQVLVTLRKIYLYFDPAPSGLENLIKILRALKYVKFDSANIAVKNKDLMQMIAHCYVELSLIGNAKSNLRQAIGVLEAVGKEENLTDLERIEIHFQTIKCIKYLAEIKDSKEEIEVIESNIQIHDGLIYAHKRFEQIPKELLIEKSYNLKKEAINIYTKEQLAVTQELKKMQGDVHLKGGGIIRPLTIEALEKKLSSLRQTMDQSDTFNEKIWLKIAATEKKLQLLRTAIPNDYDYDCSGDTLKILKPENASQSSIYITHKIFKTELNNLYTLVPRDKKIPPTDVMIKTIPKDHKFNTDTFRSMPHLDIRSGIVHDHNLLSEYDMQHDIERLVGVPCKELRDNPSIFFRLFTAFQNNMTIPAGTLQAMREFDFMLIPNQDKIRIRNKLDDLAKRNPSALAELDKHFGVNRSAFTAEKLTNKNAQRFQAPELLTHPDTPVVIQFFEELSAHKNIGLGLIDSQDKKHKRCSDNPNIKKSNLIGAENQSSIKAIKKENKNNVLNRDKKSKRPQKLKPDEKLDFLVNLSFFATDINPIQILHRSLLNVIPRENAFVINKDFDNTTMVNIAIEKFSAPSADKFKKLLYLVGDEIVARESIKSKSAAKKKKMPARDAMLDILYKVQDFTREYNTHINSVLKRKKIDNLAIKFPSRVKLPENYQEQSIISALAVVQEIAQSKSNLIRLRMLTMLYLSLYNDLDKYEAKRAPNDRINPSVFLAVLTKAEDSAAMLFETNPLDVYNLYLCFTAVSKGLTAVKCDLGIECDATFLEKKFMVANLMGKTLKSLHEGYNKFPKPFDKIEIEKIESTLHHLATSEIFINEREAYQKFATLNCEKLITESYKGPR